MPTFDVLLTRDCQERVTVRVTSDTEEDAYDFASEGVTDGSIEAEWEYDIQSSGRKPIYRWGLLQDVVTQVEIEPPLPKFVEVKTKLEIDMFVDWVVTALEGGIGYWSDRLEYWPPALYEELKGKKIPGVDGPLYADFEFWERGGEITLFDAEAPLSAKPFCNRLTIQRVLEVLPNMHMPIANRLFKGEYDAEDADYLVQMAIFKEIVFG